ncbi:hypothetical protein niasHT_002303 [Heterodera trifolii]|uniref:Amino acid transporter n=1 Tax=Heterodera trifolii TaxID=157864 RepID=A0ABD2LM04_9BILA
MGRWGATSYIISNIVGSGLFITPTSILNHTQSVGLSLTVWALSAAIAILGAFCYIELGTSIRRSGGDFAYLCHVKWRSIAFSFMACGCILTFPLTLAIQAETFAQYFLQGFGIEFEDEWTAVMGRKCIGYALTWLLLFLNFFSLGSAVSRFQIFCSAAKLLSIFIVIATGFYLLIFHGQTHNLRDPFANSVWEPGHLVEAFFAGLFSYDGWDILNFGAEEVANPRSTMRFAILVGILFVAFLYFAVNLSFFVVLTVPQIQSSSAVATTFAQHSLGPFQVVVPFLICIVLLGSLNSTLFVASRYLYAAARERQLPAFLCCVNERHESPRAALIFHVLLAIAFSFLGAIDRMIAYVAFAMWLQRFFTMAALLNIRIRRLPVHSEALRIPLVFPLLFLAFCLALVTVTVLRSFSTSSVGLAMLAVAFFSYSVLLRKRSLFLRFSFYRRFIEAIDDAFASFSQIVFDGEIRLNFNNDEKKEEILSE